MVYNLYHTQLSKAWTQRIEKEQAEQEKFWINIALQHHNSSQPTPAARSCSNCNNPCFRECSTVSLLGAKASSRNISTRPGKSSSNSSDQSAYEPSVHARGSLIGSNSSSCNSKGGISSPRKGSKLLDSAAGGSACANSSTVLSRTSRSAASGDAASVCASGFSSSTSVSCKLSSAVGSSE
eukprot:GHRR01022313.1.p1 GENE.GHRR01022313.1~~GHRR01022313.1.p1  ORF type:complete len:181 (+),score=78.27 GHRR01022313.1:1065-1607(+)